MAAKVKRAVPFSSSGGNEIGPEDNSLRLTWLLAPCAQHQIATEVAAAGDLQPQLRLAEDVPRMHRGSSVSLP